MNGVFLTEDEEDYDGDLLFIQGVRDLSTSGFGSWGSCLPVSEHKSVNLETHKACSMTNLGCWVRVSAMRQPNRKPTGILYRGMGFSL